MHIEFEATFTGVEKDGMRERLRAAGAVREREEYLMRRTVFNPPIAIPGGWMRVRDEGDKVTMSLKVVDGDKIEDQKEVQIVVNDFDQAVAMLETIGAKRKAYQETKRELWALDGAEVTIDTWPGLRPFVEVEAKDEITVRAVADKLGFDWRDAKFCEVSRVYEDELGIPPDVMKNSTPIITFEQPPQQWKP